MTGGRNLLGLVAAVQAALTANMVPDGVNDHETLATLIGLMDGPEQRAAEGQAQQDETDAELFRFMIRSMDEDSAECGVMVSLMDGAPDNLQSDQVVFVAHLAKGLALFKANQ